MNVPLGINLQRWRLLFAFPALFSGLHESSLGCSQLVVREAWVERTVSDIERVWKEAR